MTYDKGPKLNKCNFYEVPGEDNLGIKYVAINISDELQEGITSVTPRARYWSFYSWVLYDFIFNSEAEKSPAAFKKYLKRQEWYFILSNLSYNSLVSGLQGSRAGIAAWRNDKTSEFSGNLTYLSNSLGGYGIYRNVLKIIGVTAQDNPEEDVYIDRLTTLGKELAIAFETEIKETEYYISYRNSDLDVPREVIIEYGKKAHIADIGNTKDGRLLKDLFLPAKGIGKASVRTSSMYFYKYILNSKKVRSLSESEWRAAFFDEYSPKGYKAKPIPKEFDKVAKGWEIFSARVFFTYALEGIWTRTLLKMSFGPVNRRKLIELMLLEIDTNLLENDLQSHINKINTSPETRVINIRNITDCNNDCLTSSLNIMISIFLRINDRGDFGNYEKSLLNIGSLDQLSLNSWIDTVYTHLNQPVAEIMVFIIDRMILNQHVKTALDKLHYTGNQTYHFFEEDGLLYHIYDDHPSFNVVRPVPATVVMSDLGLL